MNFVELRYGEVQHSPVPIGPGDAEEGRSYRRVLCAAAGTRAADGLGHRDAAKRLTVNNSLNDWQNGRPGLLQRATEGRPGPTPC
jgi:hypothetical protein